MLNRHLFFDLTRAWWLFFACLAAGPGLLDWSRSCAQGAGPGNKKLRNFVVGKFLELGNNAPKKCLPPKPLAPQAGGGEHLFVSRSCVNAARRVNRSCKKKKKKNRSHFYYIILSVRLSSLFLKLFSRNFHVKYLTKKFLQKK